MPDVASRSTSGSAAARRPTAAAASSKRLAQDRNAAPSASTMTSTSRSPATSRTRCSARPARPRSTARRRAPRQTQVATLDARNAAWADAARGARGPPRARHAGCRGGRRCRLRAAPDPGPFRVVRAAPRRRARRWTRPTSTPELARADLVITGEGRIDAQTAFGKTALGVAKRAAAAGVPCIAVGGGVEPDGIAALAAVGAVAVPVVERPQSVEEAMAAGTAPLERCGERLASLTNALTKSSD